jgi:hypothetical protein
MAWQRGRSYSQDLRERVLAANDLTSRQAAARFSVSVSRVIKVRQRRERFSVVIRKNNLRPASIVRYRLNRALAG